MAPSDSGAAGLVSTAWLRFMCLDMRALPTDLPAFDRITGNLSVMFFRPSRFDTVRGLVAHLKPGGRLVLTFPSLGTFDSLWRRIDREIEGRGWLEEAGLARIRATEQPLEIATGSGPAFLYQPLLRGGFLDDAYECFEDQRPADGVMTSVSEDLPSFTPLLARRCVLSGWKP